METILTIGKKQAQGVERMQESGTGWGGIRRLIIPLVALALLIAPSAHAISIVGNTSFVRWSNPAPSQNFSMGASTFFVDNTHSWVGIGTRYPNNSLSVVGNVSILGNIVGRGNLTINNTGVPATLLYVDGPAVDAVKITPYIVTSSTNGVHNLLIAPYWSTNSTGIINTLSVKPQFGNLTDPVTSNGIATGLYLYDPLKTGGSTVQKYYELYMDKPTVANETNYGIYSVGGQHYFGGNMTVLGGFASLNATNLTSAGGAQMGFANKNFSVYGSLSITDGLYLQGRNFTVTDDHVWQAKSPKTVQFTQITGTTINTSTKRYYFNDTALWIWYDLGDSNPNETTAGKTLDLSGNGRNGILSNVTINDTGRIGNALNFTAETNSTIYLPQQSGVVTLLNNYSFSIRIRGTGAANGGNIVSHTIGASDRMALGSSASGSLTFGHYNGSSYNGVTTAGHVLDDAKWHFVAVIHYDNQTNWMFLDGAWQSLSSSPGTTSVAGFVIGARTSGTPPLNWNGSLDDFKLWNRTITPAEITALYNNGLPSGDTGSMETNFTASTGFLTPFNNVTIAGFVNATGLTVPTLPTPSACAGSAVLVAGGANVVTTCASSTSLDFTTTQANGGTIGTEYVSGKAAGRFDINSTSGTDTSTVAWFIVNGAT